MLEQIKRLLGIELSDESQDELLKVIIDLTSSRLCVLCDAEEVPSVLQYIITEVSVIRFNRIGSEGFTSHGVEGESISWNDDSDFTGFMDDIGAWKQNNRTGGVLRFL